MATRTKGSRWNLRVDRDEDVVVRRAAAESDRELSDFVRGAALAEAERVLADRTVFTLGEEDWERFVTALERPARVPDGLRELFSRPSVFEGPSE
jgi:uncharacterized protein (DUF1778 family)